VSSWKKGIGHIEIKKQVMIEEQKKAILLEHLQLANYAEKGTGGLSISIPESVNSPAAVEALKMQLVEQHSREIMQLLGIDLNDEILRNLPGRLASLFINEWFGGLNPANRPVIKLSANLSGYKQMTVAKNIGVYTYCACHLLPVTGNAQIGYFSNHMVLDQSAVQKIVKSCCQHAQTQEKLTQRVAATLKEVFDTSNVAVLIEAVHQCPGQEGDNNKKTSVVTAEYAGKFVNTEIKNEFLKYVGY
jgi:GTP cyclohydrolase IA